MEPISYLVPRFQERRRLFREVFPCHWVAGRLFALNDDHVDRPARALLLVEVAGYREDVRDFIVLQKLVIEAALGGSRVAGFALPLLDAADDQDRLAIRLHGPQSIQGNRVIYLGGGPVFPVWERDVKGFGLPRHPDDAERRVGDDDIHLPRAIGESAPQRTIGG
jgi:hypothetical protein